MAINPNTQYPGQVVAPNAAYPYGGAQNITAPGDNTGTPWEAALLNDIFGQQQALLKTAGIVPSGSPDQVGASQYLQAITELVSGRATTYTAGGTANAITLTAIGDGESPASYFVGLVVEFTPASNNTGATTVNLGGLGVINVFRDGVALLGGEFKTTDSIKLVYDGVRFILQTITDKITKLKAHPDTAQTLPNGSVETLIDLKTVLFDINNEFDITNSRFTPKKAGYYLVKFNVRGSFFSVDAATQLLVRIRKNGVIVQSTLAFDGSATETIVVPTAHASDLIYLNGNNDYVDISMWQNSTGTLSLGGDVLSTSLSIIGIG